MSRLPNADQVLAGMTPWLKYGPTKPGPSDKRTEVERAWDAAIFAAAEYVRRLTNYNESLSLTILDLLTAEFRSTSTRGSSHG